MFRLLKAWLKEQRRRRVVREAIEMADIIERAYFCRRMSPLIDSVLSFRERRGYITGRQYRHLRALVISLESGF